ncbi:multicopper oxidase family protein [Pseudonocardia sp. McavD-2-B]|uniref:multicopper oxidase family protein n=1 Tax=Pseudonocardia sp. McavD-2-B TaxID=2954499 RepID=UPI002096AC3F|nr:multicopper oxidase domain-containing protein [Pseudonocardia sp. McavD-2-B]MCO7196214.1 multicopper oxidase family protein [Pseudonocardia sp. McavD-2-B]
MTRQPRFSRRHLLGLAAAAGVAGGVAACTGLPRPGPAGPAAGAPFADPPERRARGGLLTGTLTAGTGVDLAGVAGAGLGYDGTSPGPTLRLRPGDEIALHLHNGLDTPTNLHTHGLRVPPDPGGDDPFRTVAPGETADYRIRVPRDHPAGTFWYHPHHHGTVADQVFAGLVGALVVEGGPDLGTAEDHVLVVTDTTLGDDGRVAAAGPMDRVAGREGELVLVNGLYRPVLAGIPQRSQRWRLVNATCSRVFDVSLDGQDLVHVATDGVFLPRPVARDRVRLAPGNRADVVVRPPDVPGDVDLLAADVDRGGMGGMGGTGMGGTTGTGPVVLATLRVTGAAAPTPPPPAVLSAPVVPPGPPDRTRVLTLTAPMGGGGMGFGIDGRGFDPARDDLVVAPGTVEEWVVENPGTMLHPLHLHTWPMTVLDAAGSDGAVRDVVTVPAGGRVVLRVAFTGATGRTVLHCHVLDHEDAGMMATVRVGGAGTP